MSGNNKVFSNLNWFSKTEKIISIIASLAVIGGIIFALIQVVQSNNFEKRRIAIEAIAPTRSNEFIKSYTKLIQAYDAGQPISISLIDDLNFVMNVYDNIAILYLNGLADKNLIKSTIYDAMQKLVPILDSISPYPQNYRVNFDFLLSELEKQ